MTSDKALKFAAALRDDHRPVTDPEVAIPAANAVLVLAALVADMKDEMRSLRQRHAAEVEAAFREAWANGYANGLDPNRRNVTVDAAWLSSEARRKVGT